MRYRPNATLWFKQVHSDGMCGRIATDVPLTPQEHNYTPVCHLSAGHGGEHAGSWRHMDIGSTVRWW